jgi:hypothetical protein
MIEKCDIEGVKNMMGIRTKRDERQVDRHVHKVCIVKSV